MKILNLYVVNSICAITENFVIVFQMNDVIAWKPFINIFLHESIREIPLTEWDSERDPVNDFICFAEGSLSDNCWEIC